MPEILQNTNTTNKSHLKLIFITASIIVVIIFIIFAILFINRGGENEDRISPKQYKDPITNTGSDLGMTQKEAEENRGYKIAQLSSELPYNGVNFSLSYDYDTDEFTLYINPDAQEQGNSELTAFLKQNQIDSVSWLYNLKRVSQKP